MNKVFNPILAKTAILFFVIFFSAIHFHGFGNKSKNRTGDEIRGRTNGLVTISFTINATSGASVHGARLIISGINNSNYYQTTYDNPTAVLQLEIIPGEYLVSIAKPGHPRWEKVCDLSFNQHVHAMLTDIHYSPQNIEIDSVSLLLTWDKPTAILLDEDFEGELFPPEGWQIMTSGQEGWHVTENGSSTHFNIPPHSTYAVSNDDAANGNGCCELLITPLLDLTEQESFTLQFSSFYTGANDHKAFVLYSTDNGINWNDLGVPYPYPYNDWMEISIDLTDFSGFNDFDSIRFAFHSDDAGGHGSGWAIDDVKVINSEIEVVGHGIFIDGLLVDVMVDPITSYNCRDLEFGQEYQIGVSALYSSGYSHIVSKRITSRYLEPARYLIGEVAAGNQIDLSWNDPENPQNRAQLVPGLKAFNIYRNDSLIATLPATCNNYSDSGSAYGIQTYFVKALYDLTTYGYPGEQQESMESNVVEITYGLYLSLPFYDDFSWGSFDSDRWSTNNFYWKVDTLSGSSSPCAKFSSSDYNLPSYAEALRTTVIRGTISTDQKIFLEFDIDHELVHNSGFEKLEVLLFNGSSNTRLALYSNLSSINWERQIFDITSIAENKDFKVIFFAFGFNLNNISHWKIDNVHIYTVCNEPIRLEGKNLLPDQAAIELTWEAPQGSNQYWFSRDSGFNSGVTGLSEGGTLYIGIRFNSFHFENFIGSIISKSNFFPAAPGCQYTFIVLEAIGDLTQLIYEQQVESYESGIWNELTVNDEVRIQPETDYIFGYRIIQPPSVNPAGIDAGPAEVGFGDLFSLDGVNWMSMETFIGNDNNWNIRIQLEINGSDNSPGKQFPEDELSDKGFITYHIYRDHEFLASATDAYYLDDDINLVPGNNYNYKINAAVPGCTSPFSNEVVVQYGTIGIDEIGTGLVNIYPNPANDMFVVEFSGDAFDITVFNYLGKTVFKQFLNGDKKVFIDTSNFDAGVYLVKLQTRKGKTITRKMVVAK